MPAEFDLNPGSHRAGRPVSQGRRDRLGAKAFPVQYPLGQGELFTCVVDIIRRVELVYDIETQGKTWTEGPVPDALQERVEAMRAELIEAAVEHDDELLEKYLETHELTEDEIRRAVRAATVKLGIVPIFCGAAFKNKGVQQLLDGVVDYLPSPLEVQAIQGHAPHHGEDRSTRRASDDESFSALAFKIMTDPFVGRLTFIRVYTSPT